MFFFANYIEEVREEERDILYRAFARIKIGKEEEAYSMFHYFQNESAIRRLSTESRGKMLAFLELLKEISKNKQKTERQEKEQVYAENLEETEAILAKYFKHLSNSTSGLVPGNGNVYITSFTKHEDFIPMWNAYAEDAKGCAIKFGEDFFDIKKKTDMYTGVSSYSDKSYILYEVMYLNPTSCN